MLVQCQHKREKLKPHPPFFVLCITPHKTVLCIGGRQNKKVRYNAHIKEENTTSSPVLQLTTPLFELHFVTKNMLATPLRGEHKQTRLKEKENMTVNLIKGRISSIGEVRTGRKNGRERKLVNFSVAHNPVYLNDIMEEWVQGDSVFEACVATGRLVDAVTSLNVGDPVLVTARRVTKKPFTTRSGKEIPPTYENQVEDLGLDLGVKRPKKSNGSNSSTSNSHPSDSTGSESTAPKTTSRPRLSFEDNAMDEPPF